MTLHAKSPPPNMPRFSSYQRLRKRTPTNRPIKLVSTLPLFRGQRMRLKNTSGGWGRWKEWVFSNPFSGEVTLLLWTMYITTHVILVYHVVIFLCAVFSACNFVLAKGL